MHTRLIHQAVCKATTPLYSIPVRIAQTQQRSLILSSLHHPARNTLPRQTQSLPSSTSISLPHTITRTMATSDSGVTEETLTSTLNASSDLQPLHVSIQDISGGCGQSFSAVIVSDKFVGKSTLQRHRLVNGVLREEIKAIHAWTPRCLSGEQWEREKEKAASGS